MAAGEGKGWANGRSAKNDPRIARAAAAHCGLAYTARVKPEQDRRRRHPRIACAQWTPDLAYAVGLVATDGCLFRGRTVNFKSEDRELVELFLRSLRTTNRIYAVRTRTGNTVYATDIGDVAFYRWLLRVGLTPRKSLTLGALDVPRHFTLPLVRGLLDGDGSIINKVTRADTKRRSDYYWEYLQTKFVSASRAHVDWLREILRPHIDDGGYLEVRSPRSSGHHVTYALRYGKRSSLRLLPLIYADPDGPKLTRKWRIWDDYRSRHPQPSP